jgi:hypothetical protein
MLLLNSASSADVSPETCRGTIFRGQLLSWVHPKPPRRNNHADLELLEFDGHISMLKDLLDRIGDLCADPVAGNQGDLLHKRAARRSAAEPRREADRATQTDCVDTSIFGRSAGNDLGGADSERGGLAKRSLSAG